MFTAAPGLPDFYIYIDIDIKKSPETTQRDSKRKKVPHLSLGRLQVVSRHDVDEEVKLVELGDGHSDVVPLQGTTGQGKVSGGVTRAIPRMPLFYI